MITIGGKEELISKVGAEIGVSPWFEVTQQRVDQFAESTGDNQWIHVDPEKAASGPFGGTIAHGYFTLSLGPRLSWDTFTVEGVKMGINYGNDRVRFITPVRVGKRVRMRIKLLSADPVEPNAVQAKFENTFEIEGEDKPACVAEVISRYYF